MSGGRGATTDETRGNAVNGRTEVTERRQATGNPPRRAPRRTPATGSRRAAPATGRRSWPADASSAEMSSAGTIKAGARQADRRAVARPPQVRPGTRPGGRPAGAPPVPRRGRQGSPSGTARTARPPQPRPAARAADAHAVRVPRGGTARRWPAEPVDDQHDPGYRCLPDHRAAAGQRNPRPAGTGPPGPGRGRGVARLAGTACRHPGHAGPATAALPEPQEPGGWKASPTRCPGYPPSPGTRRDHTRRRQGRPEPPARARPPTRGIRPAAPGAGPLPASQASRTPVRLAGTGPAIQPAAPRPGPPPDRRAPGQDGPPRPAGLPRAQAARRAHPRRSRPCRAPSGGRGPVRRVGLRRPRLRRASPARRLHASLLCVGFALSLIAGRLVQLQGLEGAAFSKQAAKYKLAIIQIPAERGSDHRGGRHDPGDDRAGGQGDRGSAADRREDPAGHHGGQAAGGRAPGGPAAHDPGRHPRQALSPLLHGLRRARAGRARPDRQPHPGHADRARPGGHQPPAHLRPLLPG